MFLLDSDKQSFRVDNVPKFIKIKAAIIKMQCFKKYRVFFCTLNENMSMTKIIAIAMAMTMTMTMTIK